jgi:hypothetical protein|eukprot:COSAG01_NODE_1832_length_9109_cov_67.250721_12_plen_135_part_00
MGNGNGKEAIDERLFQPWGLYPDLVMDRKAVRKQIIKREIAPFWPPAENQRSQEDEECPICFMYYNGGLNQTVCCGQRTCTECLLQLKGKSLRGDGEVSLGRTVQLCHHPRHPHLSAPTFPRAHAPRNAAVRTM